MSGYLDDEALERMERDADRRREMDDDEVLPTYSRDDVGYGNKGLGLEDQD